MAFGVIAMILIILFTTPLILGTYVVTQAASLTLLMRWFTFVTGMLALSLLAGVVALLTIP